MDRDILLLALEDTSYSEGLVRLVCFVHVRAVSARLACAFVQNLLCLVLVK